MVVKMCLDCGSYYETLKDGDEVYYETCEVQDKRYLDKFKKPVIERCFYCKDERRKRCHV